MKVEALRSSETLESTNQTMRCHNPENQNMNFYSNENAISRIYVGSEHLSSDGNTGSTKKFILCFSR
jgi:hypothetical protein